jgi:hypothetical protein
MLRRSRRRGSKEGVLVGFDREVLIVESDCNLKKLAALQRSHRQSWLGDRQRRDGRQAWGGSSCGRKLARGAVASSVGGINHRGMKGGRIFRWLGGLEKETPETRSIAFAPSFEDAVAIRVED